MSKTKSKPKKKNVPIPYENTDEIPHYLLRNLVDIYYDFQGQRIQTQLRIGASKRENSLTDDQLSIYGITTIFENAQNFERDIERLIVKQLKHHALYNQYLALITGIGPMLGAGLIAYIDDIENYKHASSLWQYAGYGANRFCPKCKKPTFVEKKFSTGKISKQLQPFEKCPVCNSTTKFIIQKRTSGYLINWNPRLKQMAWKAGKSFVKQSPKRSKYRKLYTSIKKAERRRHPDYSDGHIDNATMRKVVKIFLVHLWQTWRRQLGLETSEPYTKQLLGHSTVEAFTDD